MQNHRRHTDAQLDSQRAACEGTRIDLDAFLALDSEARAIRWRQWSTADKQDVVIQQITALGYEWTEAAVAHHIGKLDAKYALGPVEAAVEGALERLIDEHSAAVRLAVAAGDKAHATEERKQTTAFSNALREYKRGVRPQLLPSGAWLLPSSSGGAAHVVRMDGDWICSCKAGSSMHWPVALIVGIEVAQDAMSEHDDGAPESELAAALARTAETLDTMRARQQLAARICAARGRSAWAA